MLPGRVQPSTFGTEGLNFCVRDGNRWDPFVIATGNGDCSCCDSDEICRPAGVPLPFASRSVLDISERFPQLLSSFRLTSLRRRFAHPDNCTGEDSLYDLFFPEDLSFFSFVVFVDLI